MKIKNATTVLAGAATLSLAAGAIAAPDGKHFGVFVNDQGNLATQGWISAEGGYQGEQVIFAFDALTNPVTNETFFDFGTNSPGGAFAFPGEIGLNFMSSLQAWDGGAFGDSGTTVTMTKQDGSGESATSGSGFAPGLSWAIRDETTHPNNPAQWGRHHEDADYTINDADANVSMYMIEMSLFHTPGAMGQPQYGDSDTFWVIFNLSGSESDVLAAKSWIDANLVPGPGALAVLGLAGLCGARRRRQ
ncbi:MAG: hypothetical protein EA377_10660 [Phycisphaerales bacterium]|nr:MAG: hypothetical protein EA377_10660 [Phycisphaerales bacterium]